MGYRIEIRYADKEVHLYRGRAYYGTIICRSMERPQAIVGFKIARALVDEIDTLPTNKAREAWNKIIARLRLKVPGETNGIGVTTTPEGFRFVYEQFAVKPTKSYSMVQASTYENPHLPDGYIDNMLETYPQELISAYLDGEFVNLTSGTVYRSYDRRRNGTTETVQGAEPLSVGMDFNVGNMAAAIKVTRPSGMHCCDEVTGGLDTPSMITTLRERYPDNQITVFPDASGKNTSSKGAALSDVALLKQAGFKVRAKDSNPRVKDRVLSVNRGFEALTDWVNTEKAPTIAASLEQQAYDKNGEPDKTTGHDHANDAFGYETAFNRPVVKPTHTTTRLIA